MNGIYILCYRSRIAPEVPGADIEREIEVILAQSRHKNSTNSVTGCLLFDGSTFFQVLEGSPKDIGDTYERICNDPRHTDIEILAEAEISHRTFSDCWMGYSGLTDFQDCGLKDICKLLIDARGRLPEKEMITVLAAIHNVLTLNEAA